MYIPGSLHTFSGESIHDVNSWFLNPAAKFGNFLVGVGGEQMHC